MLNNSPVKVDDNPFGRQSKAISALLEIFSTSQVSPLKRIRLPQSCDTLEEWDLNNGIMDLKLRLKPPNSNGIISIEEE